MYSFIMRVVAVLALLLFSYGLTGLVTKVSANALDEFVEPHFIDLISSDPQLNAPSTWRPLVYWLLFAECVATDAVVQFKAQRAPIREYLASPPRGAYELRFMESTTEHAVVATSAASGHRDDDTTLLESPVLSNAEAVVFRRFIRALLEGGVKQMPASFAADRQLGALWFLQQIYYTDIPRGLMRMCTTFSQFHSVRFARKLANRDDMHFQWDTATHKQEHIPPEKQCTCTNIGAPGPYDAEACLALHCRSQLQCERAKPRVCVLSDSSAPDYVCTCSGKHGFAVDLTSNTQ